MTVSAASIRPQVGANHSGLQWSTVRNIALAWMLTVPLAAVLAGSLLWQFRRWA